MNDLDKIAIMTWWHYRNFGTALQARALMEVIRRDYFCDLINYIPNGKMVTRFNGFFKDYAWRILKKLRKLTQITEIERERKFQDFFNSFASFTDKCETSSELYRLNDQYSAFVCGSDQIWTPLHFNPKYFLDFVQDENKLVAYAPSIGVDCIADKDIKIYMGKLISRFSHLSVRE